jgi:hypothetical protein
MHSLPRLAGLLVLFGVVVGCMPLVRTRDGGDCHLAPPADGTADDGQALRLSDYHGKVVLLCFWHGG